MQCQLLSRGVTVPSAVLFLLLISIGLMLNLGIVVSSEETTWQAIGL